MKIRLTNTFFDSLHKLKRINTWHVKIYHLFRYDIPYYLKNLRRFNKILWKYRAWNGDGCLLFVEESLRNTCSIIEKYGIENDESRLKKIAKMKRACEILKNINEDLYIDIAEISLGRKMDNDFTFDEPDEHGTVKLNLYKNEEEENYSTEVFKMARELQNSEWKELWSILQGQDIPQGMNQEDYDLFYNGSGLGDWWD